MVKLRDILLYDPIVKIVSRVMYGSQTATSATF